MPSRVLVLGVRERTHLEGHPPAPLITSIKDKDTLLCPCWVALLLLAASAAGETPLRKPVFSVSQAASLRPQLSSSRGGHIGSRGTPGRTLGTLEGRHGEASRPCHMSVTMTRTVLSIPRDWAQHCPCPNCLKPTPPHRVPTAVMRKRGAGMSGH